MNIQNTENINFQAIRVGSVTKSKQIIDIFKLCQSDLADRSFVTRCLDTIRKHGSDRCGHDMLPFFRDFLRNAHSDNSKDYYLGIKNGEFIVGGFSFSPECDAVLMGKNCYNYSFAHDYYFTKDCLVYSLLANSQRRNANRDIVDFRNPPFWSNHDNNSRLSGDKIDSIKKQIIAENAEYTFNSSNEEVDLEKLMGVDNVNYQVLM